MYMYLLISQDDFAKFCTYNNLYFCSIIHNSSIHCPRTNCSIKKYNIFGCSFLHIRMRDFPLSYEGVQKPAIGVARHADRMYCRTLQLIWGRSDKFHTLFSSWGWFPARPTLYWHNENRYGQSDFCGLLTSIIRPFMWSLVWFQWLFPSQHVFD